MVTRATDPEIDWSTFPEDDGEPMAETTANVTQMLDLIWTLKKLFALQGRGPVTVSGNQFIYYNEHNGRDNISPDVYVVFGVAVPSPRKWRTWIEGKFPDVVFEITSPSTQDQDLSAGPRGKRRRYAELGAQEYYIYDPQQEMEPPLLGFELRGERLEPLPLLEGGGIVSPLLHTELRPLALGPLTLGAILWREAGTWLRVLDPRTGAPITLADEDYRALLVAEQGLVAAERARIEAERAQLAEQRSRMEAEQARLAEQQARIAAEERAARAEAALQELLAKQARRQDVDTPGEHT